MTSESPAQIETEMMEVFTTSMPEGKETVVESAEQLPPLTYVDFYPRCLGTKFAGEPQYADFQTVVEEANQWLRSMPQFVVVKCETVESKLNSADFKADFDYSFCHVSSNGKNVYLKGLRLWLRPQGETPAPVQKLAYMTVLPDHNNLVSTLASMVATISLRVAPDNVLPSFDSLPTMLQKLSRHLQQKPLPGKILTVETVTFKVMETASLDKIDTENCLWWESGRTTRMYVCGIRLFYEQGQPAFEQIGYHDEVPDIAQDHENFMHRVRFAPFSSIVSKAAHWLQGQQNIRAVNFQSLTFKAERPGGMGPYLIETTQSGFAEAPSLLETRYIKILRIFYVKDQKSENSSLYSSVHLTTRLFVPARPAGAVFESRSKTAQRIISWLSATGVPVLSAETVRYAVDKDSEGTGVKEDRSDSVATTSAGQQYVTCVRLFFPCEFQEPPPEVVPQTAEEWCVIV
ncbi:uncharacterized protein LOC112576084 [Pomacea canaliculata]|nr:uncharacterized protein LOC112576084 [Pomacea canaliculata]